MAENKDGQEKSEPASGKRLTEARSRGQVSKSVDVTTAAVLLFGGLMVFVLGKPMMITYKTFLRDMLLRAPTTEITEQNISAHYLDLIGILSQLIFPTLFVVLAIGVIADVSQVGFHFATKKFTEGLNLKSLFNPFAGIKKIFFSGRSYVELLKSFMKISILSTIVYQVLNKRTEETLLLANRPFYEMGSFMVSVSLELLLKVGSLYALLAAGDFFYQRFRFKADMKMTKQETKEESKQTEGDPKIKGRIRSLMRQRLRNIMLKNVQSADVVITNPTHYAVAISYKSKAMSAPKVVAKGADFLAMQIRHIAEEAGVPVVEQPPLARTLYSSVEIDREIPENLFKAVAQVLAYVYQLKKAAN